MAFDRLASAALSRRALINKTLFTLSAAALATFAALNPAAAADAAAADGIRPSPVRVVDVPDSIEKALAHARAEADQFAAAHPLHLRTMGSFMFGGSADILPSGETFHGDHGYAEYFVPENAKTLPIVLWHGIGQSGKCFESTPDGREGFTAILPRLGWAAYIIDQPRRGRAGYTHVTTGGDVVPTTLMETAVWDAFRNGVWLPGHNAKLNAKTQFPATPEGVDQFFRQQTPDTGAEPQVNRPHRIFLARTMAKLFERTGPVILMTHSNSGQYGWETAMQNPGAVRGIIALEPGSVSFPESMRGKVKEAPYKNEAAAQAVQLQFIPDADFEKLLKLPILIVYGDNIAKAPSDVFNEDVWRLSAYHAKLFVDEVNRRGGDAKLLHLPEAGLVGNTHGMYADLNNLEVAQVILDWLRQKGLDAADAPHAGPAPQKAAGFTIPIDFSAIER